MLMSDPYIDRVTASSSSSMEAGHSKAARDPHPHEPGVPRSPGLVRAASREGLYQRLDNAGTTRGFPGFAILSRTYLPGMGTEYRFCLQPQGHLRPKQFQNASTECQKHLNSGGAFFHG